MADRGGSTVAVDSGELLFSVLRYLESLRCDGAVRALAEHAETRGLLPCRYGPNGVQRQQTFEEMRASKPHIREDHLQRLVQSLLQAAESSRALKLGISTLLGSGSLSLAGGLGSLTSSSRRLAIDNSVGVTTSVAAALRAGPRVPRQPLHRLALTSQYVGARAQHLLLRNAIRTRLRTASATVGHLSPVYSATHDLSGRIYTAADDAIIKVWCAESGRLLGALRAHVNAISDIAVDPEGRFLVSCGLDKTVRVWDLDSGSNDSVILGHTGTPNFSVFSPQHGPIARIVSSGDDGTVRVWRFVRETGQLIDPPDVIDVRVGVRDKIKAMALSPGGAFAVVGCAKFVKVVRLEPSPVAEIASLEGHAALVTDVEFCPSDVCTIASGSLDGTARVWRWRDGAWMSTVCDTSENQGIEPEGDLLPLRRGQARADAVPNPSPATQRIIPVGVRGAAEGARANVPLAPVGGASVGVTEGDASAAAHEEGGGNEGAPSEKMKGVCMMRWTGCGQYLCVASGDNLIRVYAKNGRLLRLIRGHREPAFVLERHPTDPALMLSAGNDGWLCVWDVTTGVRLSANYAHVPEVNTPAPVLALHWAPDGLGFVAADSYGYVRMFDCREEVEARTRLPTAQFLESERRQLVRDANFVVIDEHTQRYPHLTEPGLVCDLEGLPHPPHLQWGTARLMDIPRRPADPDILAAAAKAKAALQAAEIDAYNDASRPRAAAGPKGKGAVDEAQAKKAKKTAGRGRGARGEGRSARSAPSVADDALDDDEESEDESDDAFDVPSEDDESDFHVSDGEARSATRGSRRSKRRPRRKRRVLRGFVGSHAILGTDSEGELEEEESEEEMSTSDSGEDPDVQEGRRGRRKRRASGSGGDGGGSRRGTARGGRSGGTARGGRSARADGPAYPSEYLPPAWITGDHPGERRYVPQVGDAVVYLRRGHVAYLAALAADGATDKAGEEPPDWFPHVKRCTVRAVRYDVGPPTRCHLELSCPMENSPPFELRVSFRDTEGTCDFVVLESRFDAAKGSRALRVGSAVRVWPRTGGGVASGHVVGVAEGIDEDPWDSVKVRCADGTEVSVCPWEIEGADSAERAEDGWPTDRAARGRLVRVLDDVMKRRAAQWFKEPVDYEVYPEYLTVVAYPVDLGLVRRRLQNGYYRRLEALLWDIDKVQENARTFNEEGSSVCIDAANVCALLDARLRRAARGDADVAVEDAIASNADGDVDVVGGVGTSPRGSATGGPVRLRLRLRNVVPGDSGPSSPATAPTAGGQRASRKRTREHELADESEGEKFRLRPSFFLSDTEDVDDEDEGGTNKGRRRRAVASSSSDGSAHEDEDASDTRPSRRGRGRPRRSGNDISPSTVRRPSHKRSVFGAGSDSSDAPAPERAQEPVHTRSGRVVRPVVDMLLLGDSSEEQPPRRSSASHAKRGSPHDASDASPPNKRARTSRDREREGDASGSPAGGLAGVSGRLTASVTKADSELAAVGPELSLSEMVDVHKQLMSRRDAGVFNEPVPKSMKDYHMVIAHPMDLGTIASNLDAGEYAGVEAAYIADVRLVFDNCRTYNEPGSAIYEAAESLWQFFEEKWTAAKTAPRPTRRSERARLR